MEGLYPINGSAPNCAESIINLSTGDATKENMYSNSAICPKLAELESEVNQGPEVLEFQNMVNAKLQKTLAGIFGWSLDKPTIEIFDCFQTHTCHGMEFPSGVTPDLFTEVNQNVLWFTKAIDGAQIQNYTYSQIAIGSFLQDIIDLIDAVHTGSSEVKLALYSGHDTTILPFLLAYRIWDAEWPPYASLVQIEVLTDMNAMEFVRIIYNGLELLLPDCNYQSPCPYEHFVALTKNIINGNAMCGISKRALSRYF